MASLALGWAANGWISGSSSDPSPSPDTTMHSECLVLFDVRVVLVLHIFLLEGRLRFIELLPTAGLLTSL